SGRFGLPVWAFVPISRRGTTRKETPMLLFLRKLAKAFLKRRRQGREGGTSRIRRLQVESLEVRCTPSGWLSGSIDAITSRAQPTTAYAPAACSFNYNGQSSVAPCYPPAQVYSPPYCPAPHFYSSPYVLTGAGSYLHR